MDNNGLPSSDFRSVLRQTFGIKKPKKLEDPAILPIHDTKSGDKPKTIGNIMLAAAAQGIYGGGPTPPPTAPTPVKPATKAQAGQGTAPAMSQQGPWGTPEKE